MRSDSCSRHADIRILDTTTNQRRYTYNDDLLWILDHLSQHGKIVKLRLGFGGRRNVRMCARDGHFLNALKGIKTDKLSIGDPQTLDNSIIDVRVSQSMLSLSIQIRGILMLGSLVHSMLTPNFFSEMATSQNRSSSREFAQDCDGPSSAAEGPRSAIEVLSQAKRSL